jgi:hypothetical protein
VHSFTGARLHVDEFIAEREIQIHARRCAPVFARGDLMALAVEVWSLEVIEKAPGEDAARVLPAPIRLRAVTLNLPSIRLPCSITSPPTSRRRRAIL